MYERQKISSLHFKLFPLTQLHNNFGRLIAMQRFPPIFLKNDVGWPWFRCKIVWIIRTY